MFFGTGISSMVLVLQEREEEDFTNFLVLLFSEKKWYMQGGFPSICCVNVWKEQLN